MKQYLPKLHLITLMAGCVGMLLRFWLLLVGEDEKGLYPANHFSWIVLLILTGAVLVFLFLVAGFAGKSRNYSANFPASRLGAAGYVVAALGLVMVGLKALGQHGMLLYSLSGVIALLSGALLLLGGWCRLKGSRPHFLVFAAPCLYFGLRLFCMGHDWGDEPEMCRFLFPFLATTAVIPALYQLWAFAVGLGNRATSLLSSLIALYLCMVAVPGDEDGLFYMAMALFLLLNLCPRKRSPRRAPPAPPVEEAPAPAPEDLLPEDREAQIDAIIAEIRLQTDDFKE